MKEALEEFKEKYGIYASGDKICDDCIRSPVCRLLKGEIDSQFAVAHGANFIEELMRLKYQLAEKCVYYRET